MSPFQKPGEKMTNYRWIICCMLFFATTINYLDRQVLSLTWKNFIAPEFHWTDTHYGYITATFTIVYALSNIFAGRFVDWMGSRKGYIWSIAVWSVGACMHAFCGWATEHTVGLDSVNNMLQASGSVASMISITSVYYFIAARIVLGVGESGNFPAAVKVTAEYFPKQDRAFATSLFNAGSTVGALIAPLSIPTLASYFKSINVGNGWEMAFILIGALGFIWMGLWMWLYKKPDENARVNKAELAYIRQDEQAGGNVAEAAEHKMTLMQVLSHRQAWVVILGKFMTDGVWWFLLFWVPAYVSDVYQLPSSHPTAQLLLFVLYAITMLSIYGGKLPTIIIKKTGKNPYDARMKAMLIFALFPLLAVFVQPLGQISYWYSIIIIGLVCAAHQSWSANIYTVGSDLFPKSAVATIVGLGGMAGGVSSALLNLFSGMFFDYADRTQMTFMGFQGKETGYFFIFCLCAVSYLAAWCVMKLLVPHYKVVNE